MDLKKIVSVCVLLTMTTMILPVFEVIKKQCRKSVLPPVVNVVLHVSQQPQAVRGNMVVVRSLVRRQSCQRQQMPLVRYSKYIYDSRGRRLDSQNFEPIEDRRKRLTSEDYHKLETITDSVEDSLRDKSRTVQDAGRAFEKEKREFEYLATQTFKDLQKLKRKVLGRSGDLPMRSRSRSPIAFPDVLR